MIIACCAASRNNAERVKCLKINQDLDLIDCSYQSLSSLPELIIQNASVVKHLILDGNQLDENSFRNTTFPALKSLSFNCNQVANIGVFVQHLSHRCPKLNFLSLINNPGWPHPLLIDDQHLYQDYIYATLKFLPKLRFLDSVDLKDQRKVSSSSTSSTCSSCCSVIVE